VACTIPGKHLLGVPSPVYPVLHVHSLGPVHVAFPSHPGLSHTEAIGCATSIFDVKSMCVASQATAKQVGNNYGQVLFNRIVSALVPGWHVWPFPVYPALHTHCCVTLQSAFTSQVAALHSEKREGSAIKIAVHRLSITSRAF
jgi:hypothetical protein